MGDRVSGAFLFLLLRKEGFQGTLNKIFSEKEAVHVSLETSLKEDIHLEMLSQFPKLLSVLYYIPCLFGGGEKLKRKIQIRA